MALGALPHFETAADGSARDIAAGLDPGRYVGQVRLPAGASGVLYATAKTAPSDDSDYFHARGGQHFRFAGGNGASPTWVKAAAPEAYDPDGLPVTVALRAETAAERRSAPGSPAVATITVAELAAAIRVGDSAEETAEVERLLGYAVEAVSKHAPTAPAVVANEAVVRLVGYLFDAPTAGRRDAFAFALRSSGAARMLLPYVIHGAGAS